MEIHGAHGFHVWLFYLNKTTSERTKSFCRSVGYPFSVSLRRADAAPAHKPEVRRVTAARVHARADCRDDTTLSAADAPAGRPFASATHPPIRLAFCAAAATAPVHPSSTRACHHHHHRSRPFSWPAIPPGARGSPLPAAVSQAPRGPQPPKEEVRPIQEVGGFHPCSAPRLRTDQRLLSRPARYPGPFRSTCSGRASMAHIGARGGSLSGTRSGRASRHPHSSGSRRARSSRHGKAIEVCSASGAPCASSALAPCPPP